MTADEIPSCLFGDPMLEMSQDEAEREVTRRMELPTALELLEERSRRADEEDLEAVRSDDSDRDEDWDDGVVSKVERAIQKQRERIGGG